MEGGMIAISLFDYSAEMMRPWADAGLLCYCVDTQHPTGEAREGNIIRVGEDIRDWLPPRERIAFVAAFPPCTDLAVSGARWFQGKGLGALRDAIDLFHRAARICEWSGAPYLIENPVSTISTYWRKPDYNFDPCDYAGYADDPAAEAYTKRTCLWTGGGFVMPEPQAVVPILGSMMHRLPPSDERANIRSKTPQGFARAVFHANYRAAIAA
jgi:hypothetical protein